MSRVAADGHNGRRLPAPAASSSAPLLTAQELATRLNVSVGWVYRYRGPGRIVLGSLVRFDYDAIIQGQERA